MTQQPTRNDPTTAQKVVLDMSMSLDGYIADLNDFLGGHDGERLHQWAADGVTRRRGSAG